LNANPDIGLPTPEGEVKKTNWALLKEQNRLKKMQTDEPKYKYLVEAVGNIARSISNHQNSQTNF